MFRRWIGSLGSVDDEVFTDSDSSTDGEAEYTVVPEYSSEMRYLLKKKQEAMDR